MTYKADQSVRHKAGHLAHIVQLFVLHLLVFITDLIHFFLGDLYF